MRNNIIIQAVINGEHVSKYRRPTKEEKLIPHKMKPDTFSARFLHMPFMHKSISIHKERKINLIYNVSFTRNAQSHIDEQSDREEDMRDCESSDEGVNVNANGTAGMDFSSSRSPNRNTDLT